MDTSTKDTVIQSSAEKEVKGKAKKKAGKRIGFNYIILKSLKESQKNDVVTCIYIKSLTNFGKCVIKEGTYGDSKDKHGRDIKDRLIWQRQLHESLQDKVRLPRLLGSFEENGNYYLVLEHIKGKSVFSACKEVSKDLRSGLIKGTKTGLKFLGYIIQMLELLENLHKHQIIHRDVTATNFMITPGGKMTIIDMELSYSLKEGAPNPPFQLGTHGYMSPEQEATETPTVAQDVFSAGAIILQVWSGISPVKIIGAALSELREKIYFLIPDKLFADVVVQALHTESNQRPSLIEMREIVLEYMNDLKKKKQRISTKPNNYSRDQIREIIQRSICTISSPLMADVEKGWFSEDKNADKNRDKKKINKAWYASFNKGAAGMLYMLSKALSLGFDTNVAKVPVGHALRLIEQKYINRINEVAPGLHFGASGIAACLSTAISEGLIEAESDHFIWIHRLLETRNIKLGYMNGVAGQGLAHLQCLPYLHGERTMERLHNYAQLLQDAQEKDGSWVTEIIKTKKRVTRGFAYGVAGITYFLLEYAKKFNDDQVFATVERGLHWLMKKALHKGEIIDWQSKKGKEISPWWCEGAPGIALLFLNAYSATSDEKYKAVVRGALKTNDRWIIDNNLSQCHGLCGLGEIYLEAFSVLQEQEWLDRADWITQVIMHLKKEHVGYGPYWLVERERQPVADFMVGNSGVVHYLMRHCYPEKVGFPLLKT